jgi:hypothetical protein
VLGILEIGSHELSTQAGFEQWSSWSLPPVWLGLQVWATSAWQTSPSLRSLLLSPAVESLLRGASQVPSSCQAVGVGLAGKSVGFVTQIPGFTKQPPSLPVFLSLGLSVKCPIANTQNCS